jgi:hypothetical protein
MQNNIKRQGISKQNQGVYTVNYKELSATQKTVTITRVVYVATIASRRHITVPTP